MKCIELFAGIGGFRLAADACGLETLWANDICATACKVYRSRFGDGELAEGDIECHIDSIPSHDFLTGGFPCQPFSSAGKKQGVKDPRGTLFHRIVQVLKAHQPRIFVLENVKRLLTMEHGTHFATILDSLARLNYDIEWRLLKAPHFGLPQNRHRIFIVGVRCDLAFDEDMLPVRLASLKEIASKRQFRRHQLEDESTWSLITRHASKFANWGIARNGKFYASNLNAFSSVARLPKLRSILQSQDEVGPQFDFTESTIARLESSESVNRYVDGVEILSNQGGGARMGYTVFGINGIAPCLTATPSRHYERYKIGRRYRRLTNIEYARLQGFPDGHCSSVSVYNQYSLYGNAVPPPMAEWVINRASTPGIPIADLPSMVRQKELFADA